MKVLSFILAGGSGKELSVLTRHRAKTAIPFGGRYRIIDFCLSNCANSGVTDICILAQFNPKSLIKHIGMGKPWDLDRKNGGVYIMQPSFNGRVAEWYKGTGDAILQNIDLIRDSNADFVLILSGDQIYTMNYQSIVKHHLKSSKPITVVCKEIDPSRNQYLGRVKLSKKGNIVDFQEKPSSSSYKMASLGIYLFNRECLIKFLENNPLDLVFDILIPGVNDGMVTCYKFESFWEDIGSLPVYYKTSMKLLKDRSFLLDKELPLFTRNTGLPPTRFVSGCSVNNSIIADGCTIEGRVENSIVFPGVHISVGASVEDSILFPFSTVNRKAVIRETIIDKKVIVEEEANVGNGPVDSGAMEITIIGKGSKISTGMTVIKGSMIEPESVISEDIT